MNENYLVTLYEVHEHFFNHYWLFLFQFVENRYSNILLYRWIRYSLWNSNYEFEYLKLFHHGRKNAWTGLFRCQNKEVCLCEDTNSGSETNWSSFIGPLDSSSCGVKHFMLCSVLKRLAVNWILDYDLAHLDFSLQHFYNRSEHQMVIVIILVATIQGIS